MLASLEEKLQAAVTNAAGIQIDALAAKETIVSGEDLGATVNVFLPKSSSVQVEKVELNVPSGWQALRAEPPGDSQQGRREKADRSEYFSIKVPPNARPTQPYFMEERRDGDLYRWPADDNQDRPFQPLLFTAKVTVDIGGTAITLEQPLKYRFADAARGEIRRDVNVVPLVSVSLDHDLLIIPSGSGARTRRIVMSVTNNSSKPVSGKPSLVFGSQAAWKYTSSVTGFELKSKGDKTSIAFDVTIPEGIKAGSYLIGGQAAVGDAAFSQEMNTIAYPHIQTHRFYTRAQTDVRVFDLKIEPAKVGYIMGSGDDVPEAIRQMGLDVTMLEEKDLAAGDLSKFGVIVVGIRASETRPDLVSNFERLFDYARNGGNLIVQYQRQSPSLQAVLPFPAQIGPRVTDENAKVTFLAPTHPILNFPNKITDADFEGWVQERNSYDLSTFDERYLPLLEAHDPGEPENKGGLVVADIGRGKYIYCSYSLFRQLPSGVPGAYRLFANMLSLRNGK